MKFAPACTAVSAADIEHFSAEDHEDGVQSGYNDEQRAGDRVSEQAKQVG
jgi:hypothetical protein